MANQTHKLEIWVDGITEVELPEGHPICKKVFKFLNLRREYRGFSHEERREFAKGFNEAFNKILSDVYNRSLKLDPKILVAISYEDTRNIFPVEDFLTLVYLNSTVRVEKIEGFVRSLDTIEKYFSNI